MFCAPTFMFCALPSDSITSAIAVNGGTITTSTSVISPRSSSIDSTKRADSACVIFIFQLAATIFFLMNSIHHEDHEGHEDRGNQIKASCSACPSWLFIRQGSYAWQFLSFQKFQRRTATGGNKGHFIG